MSGSGERPLADASHARVFAGGVFMGLANLVPGVSGGTMILALGLYDRFIGTVAELARLRFTARALVFAAVIGAGLVLSVVALSTPAVWLVTEHRWLAYSLFIGMTLGGVPMLWRVVRRVDLRAALAAAAGFGLMAVVAFGLQDTVLPLTVPVFLGAGALAASSMILPGISGSYILLILGLYDVVVGSLRPAELLGDTGGALTIIVPVVLGAGLGVALLSNLLQYLLGRFTRGSHGFLLGLLVGSVLGLWPFQAPVHRDLVDDARLDAVAALVAGATPDQVEAATGVAFTDAEATDLGARYAGRSGADLKLLALQLETYRPGVGRLLLALTALVVGFFLTRLLGGRDPHAGRQDSAPAPGPT